MDTLYYRKVAEIMKRDESEAKLTALAERVIATDRSGKARIAKRDKRALEGWMRRWCDSLIEEAIDAAMVSERSDEE